MPIKKIHYFWFGGQPLSELAIKCINSWKKFMPDYKIIRWDEHNYDLNKYSFAMNAYKAKKYAYVSDIARFDIAFEQGGIILDTDVELIASLDDLVNEGSFMGMESGSIDDLIKKNESAIVAPGLGIYARPKMKIYKEILNYYKNIQFDNNIIFLKEHTSPKIITKILKNNVITKQGNTANVREIYIYPKEYFNPITTYESYNAEITKLTHSIHHFAGSWLPVRERKWLIKMRNKSKKMKPDKFEKYKNKLSTKIKKHLYVDGIFTTLIKIFLKLFS